MKPLLSYLLGVSLALASAFTCAAAPPATVTCDSAYVTQAGNVITVLPTGTSDTVNLQCAFDLAVAAGVSTDVRLVAGTYHTAQVLVFGFNGRWLGVGADHTVLMNIPDLYVRLINVHLYPPSLIEPPAVLFTFVDGDIVIADMAFRIVGDEPTSGWTTDLLLPAITKSMASAVAIQGTYANAWINRVLVTGEVSDDPVFGYNLYNGISFWGMGADPPPPVSGSFKVTNSTFRTIASGPPIWNINNATVLISHNTLDGLIYGIDAADVSNSTFEISHNTIRNVIIGIDEWGTIHSSKFFIHNNTIRNSVYGILIEPAAGEVNGCLLKGNNVQNVSDIGILLNPLTNGCTVVGGNNKTNVVDLGTDNVLVGVNNMGTGVGPTIQHFMRMVK